MEERSCNICAAEIASQPVDVGSSNLPALSLDYVLLDNPFDRLHAYSNLDYLVKETIFKRRLWSPGDSCCIVNCQCVDACSVHPLERLRILVPVPDLWCGYECSPPLFVPKTVFLSYYSYLVIG